MNSLKIKLRKPFDGVITPMITPLVDKETIDLVSLKRLTDHLVTGGVHGIFILGTTGEGASLTARMKHALITKTCEYASGRVPVFVGITDSSLSESLTLAKEAEENGASAVVAALPYYFNLGQQEIVKYFEELADNLTLPLFIYNIPSQTKIMIEPETVKALSKHPQIAGIKDSSGNAPYFNTLLHLLKDDDTFSVFVGPDEMMASAVLLGGSGGVNSGSNLFPGLYVDLYNAAKAGNMELVYKLQEKVMALSYNIYQTEKVGNSFLKGLKMALAMSGLCNELMMPPLIPYSGKEKDTIRVNLAELNRIISSSKEKKD